MATQQEIINTLITYLETDISDLSTDRLARGNKWIWDDTPRADINGFPRISLIPVNSSFSPLGVGSMDFIEEMIFNVEIRTKKSDKFDCGTIGVQRSEGVVSFLEEEVKKSFKNNYSNFISNLNLYIIPISSNRSVVNNLVIQSLNFKVVRIN